jgi:endonuclease YncB( thermonuclease family)
VLTGALTGSLLLAPSASAASVDTNGTVVDVVDGDTVVARIDGAIVNTCG